MYAELFTPWLACPPSGWPPAEQNWRWFAKWCSQQSCWMHRWLIRSPFLVTGSKFGYLRKYALQPNTKPSTMDLRSDLHAHRHHSASLKNHVRNHRGVSARLTCTCAWREQVDGMRTSTGQVGSSSSSAQVNVQILEARRCLASSPRTMPGSPAAP